ncbi:MAG TPA: glycosyltransferase, partial [Elusimicrobiales bacterium]|nr:glycosyltransferase [Elusimicrobiales bacterium]
AGPIEAAGAPFVSIVSPARNEERSIKEAVSSFCRQDYPNLEVIVVDDCSTDATPRILAGLRSEFPRLRVIQGAEPPPGWLGKTNALELGRKAAKGEWLIFSDADVIYAPDLVSRAVAFAVKKGTGMVCLWPELIPGEPLETAVCSKLALGFAFVPAWLAAFRRVRFIAMGAGIFNMVRRDALEAARAFASLKDAVVDDIWLGLRVKAAGFGQALALAGDLLRIRIYYGLRETIEGFTKNVYPLLRELPPLLPVIIPLSFVITILPYIGFIWSAAHGALNPSALAALVLMHTLAWRCARLFRLPWYTAFLTPVGELLWWWIALRSFLRYRRKGVVWRGRTFKPAGIGIYL